LTVTARQVRNDRCMRGLTLIHSLTYDAALFAGREH
jgi:hypothetical protein